MRLLLMLLGVFLSNCTTSKFVNYDNTNPVKIEESTKGLMVHEVLPQAQSLNGTIAVKSIELEVTDNLDAVVAYMIENCKICYDMIFIVFNFTNEIRSQFVS